MNTHSIGTVARRAQLQPSTLRYYEHVGLLDPPERINGRRQYGDDVFVQLRLIKLAQRAGFTIAEIRRLLHDEAANTPPSQRWHDLARSKLIEVEALARRVHEMQQTLQAGLACECARLEDCTLCAADS